MDVYLCNITTSTVIIRPKAILCDIQSVRETEEQQLQTRIDSEDNVVSLINFEKEAISQYKLEQRRRLISNYNDIFSKSDINVGQAKNVYHKIEFQDDKYFKQRCRQIPPAMISEVGYHINLLLRSRIIRKSHSPWPSSVVLVNKNDNSLKLCIDFCQLNKNKIHR